LYSFISTLSLNEIENILADALKPYCVEEFTACGKDWASQIEGLDLIRMDLIRKALNKLKEDE